MQETYKQQQYKFIISGGGTGGHIFPAIAIANTLKQKFENIEILFVGAKGKMEMEKVPAAGYNIEGLWISGLQRKLTLDNLSFPFKVISSLIKAKNIIKQFKPDAVIGVGGFASGPTLRAAAKMGVPTLIQEQNSYPGITNKILAKSVKKICVAYDGMERFFPKEKIKLTGNPIREEMVDIKGKREEAFKFFNLSPDKKTVFVVGGSLGALSVNKAITNILEQFAENNLQLLWQTGKQYFETACEVTKEYEKKGIRVVEFIQRMDYAYALADIIISRAGAIAISEISAIGKPTIFVPYPHASEDHQRKNALALVDKNAATMILDHEVNSRLGTEIIELIENKNKQAEFSKNLESLSIKDSAKQIVEEIIKLIGK